jgi:hypothetical protein
MKIDSIKIPLVGKIIATIMFIGVFTFNLSAFIGIQNNGLSLSALKAYAATGSSSVVHRSCASSPCNITYIVDNIQITIEGSYSNCKVSSQGNCVSSTCDKYCEVATLPEGF